MSIKLFQICLFLWGHCYVSHRGQAFYTTPCLRPGGALVWGVIMLLRRCPRVTHQGCTAGGHDPEASTKTFWCQPRAYSSTWHCPFMSKWQYIIIYQYTTICIFTSYISRLEIFIHLITKGIYEMELNTQDFSSSCCHRDLPKRLLLWLALLLSLVVFSAWTSKGFSSPQYLPNDPGWFTAPSPRRGIDQPVFQLNLHLASSTEVKCPAVFPDRLAC